MPTYVIRVPFKEITITSDDFAASEYFTNILHSRSGTGGTLEEEREFVDWMIEQRLDDFLLWEISKRQPFRWRTRAQLISPHTGTGAWIAPDIFRDNTDSPFTVASNPVGKMIQVPRPGPGPRRAARGRAIIAERINDSRVRVEGVVPAVFANLDWNYRDPVADNTEAMIIISSMA